MLNQLAHFTGQQHSTFSSGIRRFLVTFTAVGLSRGSVLAMSKLFFPPE